jgi:WD40 repeat protein
MNQQVVLVASSAENSNITAWCVHACMSSRGWQPRILAHALLCILLVLSYRSYCDIARRDVSTGTAIATYKLNASPVGGLALLGRDYLLSTQIGKGSFHFWTWHKVGPRCAGARPPRPQLLLPSAHPPPPPLLQDQVHLRSFAPEPLSAVACSPDGVFCAAGGASGALHLWETSTGRLLRSWPAHYKVRPAALLAPSVEAFSRASAVHVLNPSFPPPPPPSPPSSPPASPPPLRAASA